MNNEICFLVTLLNDGQLQKVVIKLTTDQISEDLIEYPMEPDSRQELWNCLPPYLQAKSTVVEVVEIYDTFDARLIPKEPTPREEPTLAIVQREQKEWALENFGEQPAYHSLLGAGEELGELFHAHLKYEQGIRGGGAKYAKDAQDSIGDAIIFLAGYCNSQGFDLEDIVKETWAEVKKRDWKANPKNGVDTTRTPLDIRNLKVSDLDGGTS